jgi:hypothetical protein
MENDKWKMFQFSFPPDFGIITTLVTLHLKIIKREVALSCYGSAMPVLSSRDELGRQSVAPVLF